MCAACHFKLLLDALAHSLASLIEPLLDSTHIDVVKLVVTRALLPRCAASLLMSFRPWQRALQRRWERSGTWAGPSLRELAGADGHAKKKQRRQPDEKKWQANVKRAEKGLQQAGYGADNDGWGDGQLASLSANRAALK